MADSFPAVCKDWKSKDGAKEKKGCGANINMVKDGSGKWTPTNLDGTQHRHDDKGAKIVEKTVIQTTVIPMEDVVRAIAREEAKKAIDEYIRSGK
jgi:hypothetical protein